MNRQKTDFHKKLSEYFETLPFTVKGKGICVCLSGGADSVSLLFGLRELQHEFGYRLYACHFNHMIRGEEADRDEEFCKKLCRELQIELFVGRDDVPAYAILYKKTLEEAARECRYLFFSRVYSKNAIDFCATAHNKNDDAETLLFNLIRGTGSNGASSIAPYTDKLLRPMLKIERVHVEEYLQEIGQEYISDSTNDSFDYTRNYLRQIIFKELKKINPEVINAFSRYIDSCREDRSYFDDLVNDSLDCDLRQLHAAIRKRVIIRKYNDFCGGFLNSDQIKSIDKAVFEPSRRIVPIYVKHEAVVENGKLDFFPKAPDAIAQYPTQQIVFGDNELFDSTVCVTLSTENTDCQNINNLYNKASLNYDNIFGELSARNRQSGDKIRINGVNKSLKKLFIEKRIPKEFRSNIPVFSDEKGIIYVPFVGSADRVKPTNRSNRIYLNTVFNTIDIERWINADEE